MELQYKYICSLLNSPSLLPLHLFAFSVILNDEEKLRGNSGVPCPYLPYLFSR
jgi:hypothetical protein